MKQKLLKSMLLLCALVGGIGSTWATDVTGTINFGSATGSTKINDASVSGDDSQDNSWTVTTVGTSSFTQQSGYSQVGSSSKPATSITFTTTLPASQIIKAFSAKFGGFSGTAGNVTLKVGDTTVGTGSLNATNDVTVSATNTTTAGTALTVTVTDIAKGVKCYYISYTYDNGVTSTYSITYDGNGATSGTAPADATAYTSGATVTVLGNTGSLTKTGFTFDGWNTAADGTGTDRAVGSTFSITANTTLYAKWTDVRTETLVDIDNSGITNTNKYVGTDAGSFSAKVYDDNVDEIVGAAITWSSSNEAVATINASTGAVTLVGAGNTTITATYAGSETYRPSSDTYDLTVTNENPNLTTIWSEDFSSYAADAKPSGGDYSYSCTDGNGNTRVYGQNNAGGTSPELLLGNSNGTFTAIIPLITPTYAYSGDLTLTFKSNANAINVKTITDGLTVDGEASEGAGLSFNTKDTHTITFKGVTSITEYITVVFTATGSNNVRLDDIVLKGEKAILTKVTTPVISPASSSVASGTEITITCATEGVTIYYTTDGSTPTSSSTAYNPANKPTITAATTIKAIAIKDGLTDSEVVSASYTIADPCASPTFSVEAGEVMKDTEVEISTTTDGATIYYTTDGATPTTSSSVYSSAITINSDMTIKAIAVKDGMANSDVAEATYTIIDYATLPFAWNGNTSIPTGVTNSGVGTYSGAPYLKFDGTGDYIILKINEAPDELKFDIKGNGFSGGTFKVQYSTNGADYTDGATYTSFGNDTQTETISEIPSTTRYIKWVYTTKKTGNVAFGNIKAYKCESITLNASGYATFAANAPLDFSDDSEFSAWQITGVNGTAITFSQITGTVAANTGVLLKGTASATVNIPVAASGATLATNKLVGITTATDVAADTYYGLSDNKFVKVNAGTVPAGKALLPVSAVGAGVKEFTFIFDDKETGIRTIEKVSADEAAQIFDLSGRRLSKMQKGINIVNGKKILF